MFAFSEREMGQFALARNAASIKSHCATFGTVAITSRWICVIVQAAAMISIVTVAVVSVGGGRWPAAPSSLASVIEKLPACAAAINSGGLVPRLLISLPEPYATFFR